MKTYFTALRTCEAVAEAVAPRPSTLPFRLITPRVPASWFVTRDPSETALFMDIGAL